MTRASGWSFVAADLENGYVRLTQAVAGCEYVLHIATLLSYDGALRMRTSLSFPVREGALRLLRGRARCGCQAGGDDVILRRHRLRPEAYAVRRRHSTRRTGRISNVADVMPYAEIEDDRRACGLGFRCESRWRARTLVVNPAGVFGPVLGTSTIRHSILIVHAHHGWFDCPYVPKLYFGAAVDVRDVADLHIRAMTDPAAKGERFLAVAGDFLSMRDIAMILKKRMGAAAKRVPTRQLPNWMVRLAALRDPVVKQIIPELGKYKNAINEKAKRLLGWAPRSNEEAIVATAESLVRLGLLKDGRKKAA